MRDHLSHGRLHLSLQRRHRLRLQMLRELELLLVHRGEYLLWLLRLTLGGLGLRVDRLRLHHHLLLQLSIGRDVGMWRRRQPCCLLGGSPLQHH